MYSRRTSAAIDCGPSSFENFPFRSTRNQLQFCSPYLDTEIKFHSARTCCKSVKATDRGVFLSAAIYKQDRHNHIAADKNVRGPLPEIIRLISGLPLNIAAHAGRLFT